MGLIAQNPDQQSQGFERSVLQKINGFLYRCKADEHYTMLAMTSGIERIFGHQAADIIGNRLRTYSSLIHADDVARVDQVVNDSFRSRSVFDVDYRLLTRDGREVWVHETGGGVWTDKGELIYCEGAVTDIHALYSGMVSRTEQLSRIAGKTEDVLEQLRYLKLLAINAGVEAARAGEAGAGFAVLAQEMRRLAYSSEGIAKTLAA